MSHYTSESAAAASDISIPYSLIFQPVPYLIKEGGQGPLRVACCLSTEPDMIREDRWHTALSERANIPPNKWAYSLPDIVGYRPIAVIRLASCLDETACAI